MLQATDFTDWQTFPAIGAKSVPNPGEPGRTERAVAHSQLSGSRGLSSSGICAGCFADSLLIRMSQVRDLPGEPIFSPHALHALPERVTVPR